MSEAEHGRNTEKNSQILWDVFSHNGNLFTLLDTAAALFDAVVILKSGELLYVFSAPEREPVHQTQAARVMNHIVARTAETAVDSVAEIAELPEGPDSFAHSALIMQIAPLAKRNTFLAVCADRSSFSEEEFRRMDTLGRMCAAKMDTAGEGIPGIGSAGATLFTSLLAGEPVPQRFLEQNVALPEKSAGRGTQIIAVSIPGVNGAQIVPFLENCRNMITCSLAAFYEGFLVFLYHGKSQYPLSEHHNFLEYLRRHNCRCGLSRAFSGLYEMQTYFEQAKAAVEIGSKFHPDRVLYDYEEYFAYHLIRMAGTRLPDRALISPQIERLAQSDDAKGSELLDTLRVYLANINNLNEAAAILHIHRNTLFYRLRKIEDITGWNLDSGETLSNVSFALRAYDLRDLL